MVTSSPHMVTSSSRMVTLSSPRTVSSGHARGTARLVIGCGAPAAGALLTALALALALAPGARAYKDHTYQIFGKVLHKDSELNYDDLMEDDTIAPSARPRGSAPTPSPTWASAPACFGGLGFKNCELLAKPKTNNDLVLSSGGVHEPFHTDSYLERGKPFCLECCAHVQSAKLFEEKWSFKCPLTVAKGAHADDLLIKTDIFEHEFRFARRRTTLDIQTIHCPLFREPEIQEIRSTSHNIISGYFMLGLEWLFTRLISYNATALTAGEEDNYYEGKGKGQSMQSMFHRAFHGSERKTSRDYGRVDVSRVGPDATRGYAWNITFASGSNALWQEAVRELRDVKEPEKTDLYRKNKVWYQDEQYFVPPIFAMNNFTNTSIKLVGRKIAQKQLHGYHLILEVNERGAGLDFWREVVGCEVHAIEAYGKPEYFYEHFTLRHSAAVGTLQRGVSAFSVLLALATCCSLGLGAAGGSWF